MVSIYFQQLISTLFLLGLCFFNNSTAPTIPNSEFNFNKNLLGEWTYTLTVCKDNVVKDADFTIQIDKGFLYIYGNVLECNSCHKGCKITNNQIIFPEKKSSEICTEKKCYYEYEFCGEEHVLTDLFQDLKYAVNGDELTLEANGKVLKLKRKF